MKIATRYACTLLVLLLVACSQTPQDVETPEYTSPVSPLEETTEPTPTPERASVPGTPFPVPLLSPSQQAELFELLNSEDCRLPCYLGVEPGKTTFEEAGKRFKQLGMALRDDYPNIFENYLEPPPLRVSNYNYQISGFSYHPISLSGQGGMVHQIEADVSGKIGTEFYEAWKRYSLERILQVYGRPDEVLVYTSDVGHSVNVLYFEHGIIVEWGGIHEFQKEYQICMQFTEANIAWLKIITSDTRAIFEPDPGGRLGPPGQPITQILGISEAEFYNRITSDPTVCFPVQGSMP